MPALPTLESESSLSMVPSTAPDPEEVPLPRNLYFGIEDHKLAGLSDKHWRTTRLLRVQVKDQAIGKAHQLINAIKAMSAFDNTGNTVDALPHLADSLEDVVKAVRKLDADVETAAHRYEQAYRATHEEPFVMVPDVLPNTPAATDSPQSVSVGPNPAAAEPTPQAPAAAGPKPGPGPRPPHPYDRIDRILFNAR